jgi:cellulose biosynthesis protein BcsQ
VTALTIGIITAGDPACKRGLAVNLAASHVRRAGAHLCVVDADPCSRDVTTRLATAGSSPEDFAAHPSVSVCALDASDARNDPPLWVLASAGVGLTGRAFGAVLRELRTRFDVVVCDLACGPDRPDLMPSEWFAGLDWVLVAVTPQLGAVQAADRFAAQFDDALDRGDIARSVRLGVVTTGDEGSTELSLDAVGAMLGERVLASVPQLWGRAAPNVGFGAALGIGELDDAVCGLFERLAAPSELATSRAS